MKTRTQDPILPRMDDWDRRPTVPDDLNRGPVAPDDHNAPGIGNPF